MSSTRFSAVVTGSAVLVLLVAASSPGTATVSALVGPPDFASQQPRDPRTDVARPETPRELELKAATAAEPAQLANWFELAKLQEDRGAITDAEHTYKAALAAVGPNKAVFTQTAAFYNRQGRFDSTIEALQSAADLTPADATGYQLIATYYWEKAFKDHALVPGRQGRGTSMPVSRPLTAHWRSKPTTSTR